MRIDIAITAIVRESFFVKEKYRNAEKSQPPFCNNAAMAGEES